jgi:two-component system response regulator MprA
MALRSLLVVDDDPAVLSMLRRGLTLEGYQVQVAPDAEAGLVLARASRPDAIILDVMLPGMDGLEACRLLRQLGPTPILMLTARDTLADKIAGLDSGADDYLVKPFAMGELLARLRALWRRVRPEEAEILAYEDLVLDPATREVRRGERPIELRTREYELLEFLLRHPRRVLSRAMIFERVWGYDYLGESNVIDVHIRALRDKLEAGGEPRLIQTIRRAGYALRREDAVRTLSAC